MSGPKRTRFGHQRKQSTVQASSHLLGSVQRERAIEAREDEVSKGSAEHKAKYMSTSIIPSSMCNHNTHILVSVLDGCTFSDEISNVVNGLDAGAAI